MWHNLDLESGGSLIYLLHIWNHEIPVTSSVILGLASECRVYLGKITLFYASELNEDPENYSISNILPIFKKEVGERHLQKL